MRFPSTLFTTAVSMPCEADRDSELLPLSQEKEGTIRKHNCSLQPPWACSSASECFFVFPCDSFLPCFPGLSLELSQFVLKPSSQPCLPHGWHVAGVGFLVGSKALSPMRNTL